MQRASHKPFHAKASIFERTLNPRANINYELRIFNFSADFHKSGKPPSTKAEVHRKKHNFRVMTSLLELETASDTASTRKTHPDL
jgi:hypothetical protein